MKKILAVSLCLPVFLTGCSQLSSLSNTSQMKFSKPSISKPIVSKPVKPKPPKSTYNPKKLRNPGKVSGSVVDAQTKKPLAYARVDIFKGGKKLVTKRTDAKGRYALPLEAGDYSVKISPKGHIGETIKIKVKAKETTNAIQLRQVPKSTKKAKKGISGGTVVDATNAKPLAKAILRARKGVGVKKGKVLAYATSNSSGRYYFKNLSAGNYTLEISKKYHLPTYSNMLVMDAKTLKKQNVSLSPKVAKGTMRIVLNWESNPGDLDSHLRTPIIENKKYHIYFGRKNGGSSKSGAKLDVDRTGRKIKWGPETITITHSKPGIYEYSVVNYTELKHYHFKPGKFSVSRAKIDVYTNRGLIRTFYVPNTGAGNTWDVFRYNGSTGAITPVNVIKK